MDFFFSSVTKCFELKRKSWEYITKLTTGTGMCCLKEWSRGGGCMQRPGEAQSGLTDGQT